MKWFLKLKNNFDIFGLILVLAFIFFTNFKFNTWLIGWDNLMPELNLGMNIKRSFLAVWQEYQGLGLVGGMGHASDLIRQILIFPLTIFLPTNFVRYLWHFFCLALGTFGIYSGLKKYFKFNRSICFLSSLFYLLNFGTIQNFLAPFEPFSCFWGFFPWLIFALLKYLDHPDRRHLIKLICFNFLAIPSFYVPTIFLVYLICIFIVLFSHFIFTKKIKISPLIIIFLLNSFWLLPFFYFVKNDISNPQLAFGNQMASEETFLQNQNRGHLFDFFLLKGYYYDLPSNGVSIMEPWHQYFSSPIILIMGYLVSSLVIIGLIKIIFFSKKTFSYVKLSLILLFLLSAIALLSATPVFSQINYLLRQISLLDQIFRSPFTKFITPAIFSFTLLSAFGLNTIYKIVNKKSTIIPKILFLLYLFSILLFSLPVFKGNLFYSDLRQAIPADYFFLIDFFKSQNSSDRIMNLPSGSFWGWTNYRFGVNGSGFLWYGIEQPILDRAFDVWNPKNEQYYWELNYILQKRDPKLLEYLIQKYSISSIIFDDNVYFPDEKIYNKQAPHTQEMLNEIPSLQEVKKIGNITIYKNYQNTTPYSTSSINNSSVIPAQVNNPQLILSDSNSVDLKNNTENNLISRYYPDIILDKPYLIKITYKNISGYPLIFSALNEKSNILFFTKKLSKNKDWQTDSFVLPQIGDSFSQGLTLLFNNSSFNKSVSENSIKSIELYQIQQENPDITPIKKNPLTFSSNIFYYKITLQKNSSDKFLVLPQSFHKGWLAFYFNGLKPIFLKNHILANNWANAWFVSPELSSEGGELPPIHIFFWPQLLEFLGIGLTIFTLTWAFKVKK
jgi:hypothetical protein